MEQSLDVVRTTTPESLHWRVVLDVTLSPTARLLYLVLLRRLAYSYPMEIPLAELATELGVSMPTLAKALAELRGRALLEQSRRLRRPYEFVLLSPAAVYQPGSQEAPL